MSFLSRIMRFLFWLFVLSWSVWLLRRAIGWVLNGSGGASPHRQNDPGATQTEVSARRLVRDPVCGMHLDETLSIPLREGNEVLHFCSTACRDAYTTNAKKFAANG
jgi:YHS domain-containing protein